MCVLYCLIRLTRFVFFCDHDVQLSLWALCVCWRALQHILPFQIAPAFWPVLPRWKPIAQPQRKKQHNLDPGKRLSTDKLRISYALQDYGFITANQFHQISVWWMILGIGNRRIKISTNLSSVFCWCSQKVFSYCQALSNSTLWKAWNNIFQYFQSLQDAWGLSQLSQLFSSFHNLSACFCVLHP